MCPAKHVLPLFCKDVTWAQLKKLTPFRALLFCLSLLSLAEEEQMGRPLSSLSVQTSEWNTFFLLLPCYRQRNGSRRNLLNDLLCPCFPLSFFPSHDCSSSQLSPNSQVRCTGCGHSHICSMSEHLPPLYPYLSYSMLGLYKYPGVIGINISIDVSLICP